MGDDEDDEELEERTIFGDCSSLIVCEQEVFSDEVDVDESNDIEKFRFRSVG